MKKVSDFVLVNRYTAWHVEYRLYKEKTKKKTITIPDFSTIESDFQKGACFSNLRYVIGTNNRIHYLPDPKTLSKKESAEWIDLCVAKGLLPNHIDGKIALQKGIVLDLKTPRSLLYCQLCLIRYVVEEAMLVEACLHLVKNEEISIFAALALTGRTICCNYNHNFLIGSGAYSGGPSLDGVKIPLSFVIALKQYWQDREKHNKSTFGATAIIEEIAMKTQGSDVLLGWKDFKNPHIQEALNCTDPIEAISNYKKEIK